MIDRLDRVSIERKGTDEGWLRDVCMDAFLPDYANVANHANIIHKK